MWRSIGAVLAGLVAVVVLSVAVDMALESTIYPELQTAPTDPLLALALAYRTVITVIGGYITARLAPSRPVRHAVILGAIGAALALLGLVVMWGVGHHWYPTALAVTAIPACWLGGKLFARG